MANKSVTYAIVHALAAKLKLSVPSLTAVYDDFPAPNQVLSYPCASIATGSPRFQNGQPYVISKTVDPEDSHTYTVKRIVGIYEFNLQLDVWVANKFVRHQIQEDLFKALAGGLNLQLADYHNTYAHYHVAGFKFVEDESGSQRNEWRVKFDLVADVKAIVESVDHIVETVENNLDVEDEALNPQTEQEPEPII